MLSALLLAAGSLGLVSALPADLVARQQACSPLPRGDAPPTSPDTPEAFRNNVQYRNLAVDSFDPQGYTQVFENLQGATQQGANYITFSTLRTASQGQPGYDTIGCRQRCDADKNCQAFNIYIERDPTVVPGPGCRNPPSTATIKCALYNAPISPQTATNTGQFRDQFQVVVAGSNGYNKNPPPPAQPNFSGPVALPGAINAPTDSGSLLRIRIFDGPLNPALCAQECRDVAGCNFFVSHVVSKNNNPLGNYCAVYDRVWGREFATNTGQFDNEGNIFDVSQTFAYTLTQQ